eukprot:14390616-Ditylum_brightwellii.AAC.1
MSQWEKDSCEGSCSIPENVRGNSCTNQEDFTTMVDDNILLQHIKNKRWEDAEATLSSDETRIMAKDEDDNGNFPIHFAIGY